jgi:hypothetical protein
MKVCSHVAVHMVRSILYTHCEVGLEPGLVVIVSGLPASELLQAVCLCVY